MRDSFFGDAPEASLSAEIVLTPQEAFWGTLVPLDVPLRRTCPRCGGRGEVWSDWCASCGGGGEVTNTHAMRLRVPAGVREGARFRFSVAPKGAPQTFVDVRIASAEQAVNTCAPHLHLLGILQLVWGAIGLLLGASMLLLAVGAIAIGVTSADDRMAAGVTAGAFVVFAVALLAGGGVNAWAGAALRREEPRGRTAMLWLGASTCSSCRSGPRSAFTPTGCCSTTKRARVFVGVKGLIRNARARTWKDRERTRPERRRRSLLQPRLGDRAAVLLLTEPQNRFVRFHAAQSTIVFGTACLALARLSRRSAARLDPVDLRLLRLRPPSGCSSCSRRTRERCSSCRSPAPWRKSASESRSLITDPNRDSGSRSSESRIGLGVSIERSRLESRRHTRSAESAIPDREYNSRELMTVRLSNAAVLDALRAVRDPDLNRDIVTLKFVKNLRIDGGRVAFTIELDDARLPGEGPDARAGAAAVAAIPGVTAVTSR